VIFDNLYADKKAEPMIVVLSFVQPMVQGTGQVKGKRVSLARQLQIEDGELLIESPCPPVGSDRGCVVRGVVCDRHRVVPPIGQHGQTRGAAAGARKGYDGNGKKLTLL
jgi:hypothetical protein